MMHDDLYDPRPWRYLYRGVAAVYTTWIPTNSSVGLLFV